MKKLLSLCVAACASVLLADAPHIAPASVSFDYNPETRIASMRYTLSGAPAIVTADIQTNRTGAATAVESDWVSIGGEHQRTLSGDVHRLVEGDGEHLAIWNPDEDLGDVELPVGATRATFTAWSPATPPDYLVVDLRISSNRWYYADEAHLPRGGIGSDFYRQDAIVMRKIPAAGVKWTMGASSDRCFPSHYDTNVQQHYVKLTNDYYMAVFELTIGQARKLSTIEWVNGYINSLCYYDEDRKAYVKAYQHFASYNEGDTNNCPAIETTWAFLRGTVDSATSVTNWPTCRHWVLPASLLGRARTKTGVDFDLPTEAQWEFAARGGLGTMTSLGDFSAAAESRRLYLNPLAWYNETTGSQGKGTLRRVGTKLPNSFGIYDMLGNVDEMCLDWYDENYGLDLSDVENTVFVEPEGPATGDAHVCHGAYVRWDYPSVHVASRHVHQMWFGVRLMCPVGLVFPDGEKKVPGLE